MTSTIKVLLMSAAIILAFTGGRALAAECIYHQPSCTYRVGGCVAGPGTCENHGGGYCWIEYGSCCSGSGSDSSVFCAPSCDGSGGGPPCNN
jgi:hypothetical protein